MYHAFSYFISKTIVGFALLAMLVCVGASHPPPDARALLHLSELKRAHTHTHTHCAHTECSIIYWMVGLRDAPVYHFFFFVFIVLLTSWAGEVPSSSTALHLASDMLTTHDTHDRR